MGVEPPTAEMIEARRAAVEDAAAGWTYEDGSIYLRATFRPLRTDDLTPLAPPVGSRWVWRLFGEVESGPYLGQQQWLRQALMGWVPSCDLADCEPATWREWYEAARMNSD